MKALFVFATIFSGCNGPEKEKNDPVPTPISTKEQSPDPIQASPAPIQIKAPTPIKQPVKNKCETKVEKINLINRSGFSLPATGFMVEESHYLVKGDSFPKSASDGIESHIQKNCSLLRKFIPDLDSKCTPVYKNSWERVWTPAEGGKVGQGARGMNFPSREEVIWQANMFFAKGFLPTPGEKWLVTNVATKKSVVVNMGYEVGPRDSKWIGGLVPEASYVTGGAGAKVTLGRLIDQHVSYGPINCE